MRLTAPGWAVKEVEQLAARESAAEHRSPSGISSVHVKNLLGDILPDSGSR